MATVATQNMPYDGAALTYSAASGGGDRFTPGDRTFLHIKNGGGGSITGTIVTPNAVEGSAIADQAVVVAAAADRMVPVGASKYQSSDGLADITWSGTTSVTFAVVYVR